jgi:chemotaxis protein MotB
VSRKKKHEEHVNHERWLVSYADFITLLFAFFVVMFSVSQVDQKRAGRFQESFSFATGLKTDERGYLPRADDLKKAPMAASIVADAPASAPMQTVCNLCATNDSALRFPEELAELEKVIKERAELEANLVGVKVLRRGNELVLRLDATALFDSGDDQIRVEALPLLVSIADELRHRALAIRVEGHTDNVPITTARFRSNWDLATGRATTVVVTLARLGGIDPRRLAAVGYSEYQPIASNDTPEGRTENRRVDFVLSMSSLIPANDKPLDEAAESLDPAAEVESADAAAEAGGAAVEGARDGGWAASDAPVGDAGAAAAPAPAPAPAPGVEAGPGAEAKPPAPAAPAAPTPPPVDGSSAAQPAPPPPAPAAAAAPDAPAAPSIWGPLAPWWPLIDRLATTPPAS